jgi:methylmalonyl-CoA epimerase
MERKFKILRIDHVAIAVSDLNASVPLFDLLGMHSNAVESIDKEEVNVMKIFPDNKDHTIELLEPNTESSVIKKFLNEKGQGMHHIALEVDNIENAISYLKFNNINIIYESPQVGADQKLITFIHPKDTPGILIELCQKS